MSVALPLPLAGKRIVVTRARSQASSLVEAFTELGAEVVELPTIEIVPLQSYEGLDKALRNIARYQWLIVTSANTVRVLSQRMALLDLDPASFCGLRKVAIGRATAQSMLENGLPADIVAKRYVAEAVAEEIGHEISGAKILLARATIARDVVPEKLTQRGGRVDVVDAYKTMIPAGAVDRFRKVFSDATQLPDAVTFTSSSTVKNFFALSQEVGLAWRLDCIKALSIGPITSETLREFGWEPVAEAAEHCAEGLIAAARGFFRV